MIRILGTIILCLFAATAGVAQSSALSEKRLEEILKIADRIAATAPGSAPEVLLDATLALGTVQGERPLAEQVAGMNLGPMRTLERKAAVAALAEGLEERLSPRDIAAIYASSVYYGRNCYGHADAARGLARLTPERAGDGVWLALAALPRSPTLYLGDRSALRARVALIINAMEAAGLASAREAARLRALPLANIDSGQGCSGR